MAAYTDGRSATGRAAVAGHRGGNPVAVARGRQRGGGGPGQAGNRGHLPARATVPQVLGQSSVFARGLRGILMALLKQGRLPLGQWLPEPWPELPLHPRRPRPRQPGPTPHTLQPSSAPPRTPLPYPRDPARPAPLPTSDAPTFHA